MKARKILLVFLIFYVGHIQAQEIQDSVKIYFRQGYSVLEPSRKLMCSSEETGMV